MTAPRDVPIPVIGFAIETGRTFRRLHDAYYAIAKRMIVAKYPAWLLHGPGNDWSDVTHARAARMRRLFFSTDAATWRAEETWFDEKKWRAFMGLSNRQLQNEFAYAERAAQECMVRAQAIRRYMDDRHE